MSSKTENTKNEEEIWNKQKLHINEMISKLKADLKDVQGLDKDLTRQFILLGSQINKIKFALYDNLDTSFDEEAIAEENRKF